METYQTFLFSSMLLARLFTIYIYFYVNYKQLLTTVYAYEVDGRRGAMRHSKS